MTSGYLLVDKPVGPTSHDVIDTVRRVIGERRVGHTGTLDPMASGLLVVLVGRVTRLAQFLVGLPKTYCGVITLGITTDTYDRTGVVMEQQTGWREMPTATIVAAAHAMTGRQIQQPPVYSAKKVAGQPAHRLVRRGETVVLPGREVDIFSFEITGHEAERIEFRAHVSSGTYLRAMAHDLGVRLGCGAHLAELRRMTIGPFNVDAAVAPAAVATGAVRPALEVVAHLRRVSLDATQYDVVRHGRPVHVAPGEMGEGEGPVALCWSGELAAIAEEDGGWLRPRVVLTP